MRVNSGMQQGVAAVSGHMLRLHAELPGWTTLQRTPNTRKLMEMINKNIDHMPREMHLVDDGKSLQVISDGNILNLHIRKTCSQRSEEHCTLEESEWTCWMQGTNVLWEQRCADADSFNARTYYRQMYADDKPLSPSNDDAVNVGDDQVRVASMLAASTCTPEMSRQRRTKRQKTACREENCIGRVKVTTFVLEVLQSTTKVFFVSDRIVARNVERNNFSLPKAVNICYTGTVAGTIQPTAISTEMRQANKRGPCGSEIHIDTSMGVMQIFGNNGGSRKITCKAFLNIAEANYIVRRVCRMVWFFCLWCLWCRVLGDVHGPDGGVSLVSVVSVVCSCKCTQAPTWSCTCWSCTATRGAKWTCRATATLSQSSRKCSRSAHTPHASRSTTSTPSSDGLLYGRLWSRLCVLNHKGPPATRYKELTRSQTPYPPQATTRQHGTF